MFLGGNSDNHHCLVIATGKAIYGLILTLSELPHIFRTESSSTHYFVLTQPTFWTTALVYLVVKALG